MKTSAEQYQMLTDIWPRWRAIACSTGKTAKRSATLAIQQLYEFYRPSEKLPVIEWLETPKTLPVGGAPLICHYRESLIYSIWHTLADPTWVCSQIGYDRRQDIFRLPQNKRMVFAHSRITPTPNNRRRAEWITSGGPNVISQFDVDALAVLELAEQVGGIDPEIKKLARLVERIVSACFAAIMFEDKCLLIEKPIRVHLNEAQQLSAQVVPAIQWDANEGYLHGMCIYAVNGEMLCFNEQPRTDLNSIFYMTPRERALTAEFLGWDDFFVTLQRSTHREELIREVHRDNYGILYQIRFNNQIMMVVRVKNATREADGSFRRYVIPVNQQLRPLPDPNKPGEQLGQPQELTALNAVASTFGMTGAEYAEMLGSES